ncbi:MAG: selenocysteine-specific translation elongation factor [Chloroflexi bacterium]|nr:MAG: selenocysteine-specific translation elongation factor [Chloroflexota bacterium]
MFAICTAGHINHGKTTLVKQLTGTDTDRLKEEKERGISIELGFAKYIIDKQNYASFIDSPGHENFIKNMIAGAFAVDLVILVIAANEGIKEQTVEHLEIIKSLDVKNLIVVHNKIDLIKDDEISSKKSYISEFLKKFGFNQIEIIDVSIEKNIGIETLKKLINSKILSNKNENIKPARLYVDRIFSLKGKGTIVTGTVLGNKISKNLNLKIYPNNKEIKIKSLESFNQNVEEISPGSRCAVNIQNLDKEDIKKGTIIAEEGYVSFSDFVYGKINYSKDFKNNSEVIFHTGTSRVIGKIYKMPQSNLVKITLKKKIHLITGDRFILRNNIGTVGGGKIIFPNKLKNEEIIKELDKNLSHKISSLVKIEKKISIEKLMIYTGELSLELVNNYKKSDFIIYDKKNSLLIDKEYLKLQSNTFYKKLILFHKENSLSQGISVSFINENIENQSIINLLEKNNYIEVKQGYIRKFGFEPKPNKIQLNIINNFLKSINQNPYNPPTDMHPDENIIKYLLSKNVVVQSSNNVIYSKKSYDELTNKILTIKKQYGEININIIRDELRLSRKYCLSILDKMEEEKLITRNFN